MAEDDKVKLEETHTPMAILATREELIRAARRRFLWQALAATSGVALAELLPSLSVRVEAQAPSCTPGPALRKVGDITRNVPVQGRPGRLQAIIKVVNGNRNLAGKATMLRYFSGRNSDNPNQHWPPDTLKDVVPGPTLRCEVGDIVEITLLNQVNVSDFQGTLFSGERGTATGCDEVTLIGPPGRKPTDKNFYPANDPFPNCFHASSAANIHFHGTHVTPSTTGDNILVNIQPKWRMTPAEELRIFNWFKLHIFGKDQAVPDWKALPVEWRQYQMGPQQLPSPGGLVDEYDRTAPYAGGHGLPANLRLWRKNQTAIDGREWPQYYVGSYPICYPIPNNSNLGGKKMGQSPGTHWYHAHKHGSTSINLFNGMAGVFIIEDNSAATYAYDGVLKRFYLRHNREHLEEVVLIFQQLTDTINLMVGNPAGQPKVYVNGQLTPKITMRRGQVQLWRMVNATVTAFITGQFKPCNGTSGSLLCRQAAQDGVQFARENYRKQPLENTGNTPIKGPMAPANRIDLLVQAPTTPGTYVMQGTISPDGTGSPAPILYVEVTATNPVRLPMKFPEVADFPELPSFLHDIPLSSGEVPRGRDRTIRYDRIDPTRPGRFQKLWAIDGKQFEDKSEADQEIELDTWEEWTIINDTTQASHPFHIHVNPFQITEVFDPATMSGPVKLEPPYIWWDTFAIPRKVDEDGKPGYFKMRSRFVDFTGVYVQHCHILSHEDRGMMQLVEVCKKDNGKCAKHRNLQHH
jgi:FtsP/CotA-like multicopper oxidase with cupredoxin domain